MVTDYRSSHTPESIIPKPEKRNSAGYAYVTYEKRRVGYHVYIWRLYNGCWPEGVIDHIDGNKENDDPSNLREVSYQENNWNSKMRKCNTSGVKCVYWHKPRQKWVVQIRTKEGRKSFGLYSDLEEARKVAELARAEYHKDYARNE